MDSSCSVAIQGIYLAFHLHDDWKAQEEDKGFNLHVMETEWGKKNLWTFSRHSWKGEQWVETKCWSYDIFPWANGIRSIAP